MIRGIGIRPIIFSVNCYIATILTMFVAFSLDLKSPGWAMTTVYLTSQPLSGAMRAKAVYRAIGTFMVAADEAQSLLRWAKFGSVIRIGILASRSWPVYPNTRYVDRRSS
jgi:hypothetical protein